MKFGNKFKIRVSWLLVGFLIGAFVAARLEWTGRVYRTLRNAARSVWAAFGGDSAASDGSAAASENAADAKDGAGENSGTNTLRRQNAMTPEERRKDLDRRIAEMEKKAAALQASLKAMDQEDAKRKKEESKKRPRVRAGGKSKVTLGPDGQYHVAGIAGINFGSDEGRDPKLQPRIMAHAREDGEREFKGISWYSQVDLDNPVYGFTRADLTHSYDTKELSRMTFTKSFDMTEEGAKAAVEFYNGMLDQVQADLGITIKEKDNSGKTSSANLWRFTSDGKDSDISGGISTWSDNKITVTLSVGDRAYQSSVREQSAAAYDRGDPGLDSTRVHLDNPDRTVGHMKAVELINGLQ